MNKTLSLLSLLLLSNFAFAQGGLEGVGLVLVLTAIGLISSAVLVFSTFMRFSRGRTKPHLGLTISGIILMVCSLLSMVVLGSQIDSGFQATCIVSSIVALVLVVLNYRKL